MSEGQEKRGPEDNDSSKIPQQDVAEDSGLLSTS